MNISINLRRNANGRLRPNLPEPTTLEQVKTYQEAQVLADEASRVLDSTMHSVERVRRYDNSMCDFNTDKGVVAMGAPPVSKKENETLSQVLRYDTKTGETISYTSQNVGTNYRPPKVGSTPNVVFETVATTKFTNEPMSLEYTSETAVQHDRSLTYSNQQSLITTSDGLLQYTRVSEGTLRQ